jgi:translation elongation factor EF-1alpha
MMVYLPWKSDAIPPLSLLPSCPPSCLLVLTIATLLSAQADAALFVVSASPAQLEALCASRLAEYAVMAFAMGMRSAVVAVSHMDADDVAYREEPFAAACAQFAEILNCAGFDSKAVSFVPVSIVGPDNIAQRSEKVSALQSESERGHWLGGACLCVALAAATLPRRSFGGPVHA